MKTTNSLNDEVASSLLEAGEQSLSRGGRYFIDQK